MNRWIEIVLRHGYLTVLFKKKETTYVDARVEFQCSLALFSTEVAESWIREGKISLLQKYDPT